MKGTLCLEAKQTATGTIFTLANPATHSVMPKWRASKTATAKGAIDEGHFPGQRCAVTLPASFKS